MGTIDGHLLAVDAKSGRPLWNVAVAGARPEAGYAFTVAPQIVKDKLIIGPAGGDFEEQFLMLNRMSNLITTRSDSFTCYVVLQGWQSPGT